MNTMDNEKIIALLTVAKAFFDRGKAIQYDELSMDRICRITPRRELYASPEKATSQHILFLDCSSFIFSVFYQAFGYHFNADVTSDMINLTDIREFYHEIKGNETATEKASIVQKFKDTLQIGDVIVTVRNDNGHTMLYTGDNTFYHCTANGKQGSYNYKERHDNIFEIGAICSVNSEAVFSPLIEGKQSRNYLFKDSNCAFCILRPLKNINSITNATRIRMEFLQNIYIEVTCSHPEGRSIIKGEKLIYDITIINSGSDVKKIDTLYNGKKISFNLNGGESVTKSYIETVNEKVVENKYLSTPSVSVNKMEVYVPKVIYDNDNCFAIPLKPEETIDSLFEKIVTHDGEVYQLDENSKYLSMVVPGHYGGYGVITPDIVKHPEIRTQRITLSSLQSGDLIFYKDSKERPTEVVKYCGNERFEPSLEICSEKFVDSLFGQYCFCIIRSSLYE